MANSLEHKESPTRLAAVSHRGRYTKAALIILCLLWTSFAHGQELSGRAALAEAGRLLFFDSRLSQDNTTSCGSCHAMDKGTSDGLRIAVGRIGGRDPRTGANYPNGIKGNRRTPPVLNAAHTPGGLQFWDGRRTGLFNQASGPIENPDEMGDQTVAQVARRLNRFAGYRALMRAAYGDDTLSSARLLAAIVAFEEDQLSATDTLLGRWLEGKPGAAAALSASALRGAELFKAHCATCHSGPILTSGKVANTGVEFLYTDEFNDVGYQKTSGRAADLRAFKIPSLVGVSLRPPYMHNGSLPTLEHVVEHYSRGAVISGQRDPRLSSKITPFNFSADQKRDLVATLEEMTVPLDWQPVKVPDVSEFPR